MIGDEMETICRLVSDTGALSNLDPDQDFYDAGFTSVRALDLLLALEDSFGVTIPDDRFIGVRTVRGLHELVSTLRQPAAS
jgi:acyl carrier protein